MLVVWLALFFCRQIRCNRCSSAACTGGNEPPRVPLAQAPVTDITVQLGDAQAGEAQAALGPAAQSALAPVHGAPLFGAYMVAQATKDTKLADSVLAEIRKRSGSVPPLKEAR